MEWIKKIIKNENASAVVDTLILIAIVAVISSTVSTELIGLLRTMHSKAIEVITKTSQSGY